MLARVCTLVPVRLVDLSMPKLRAHAGNKAELAEWQELQRTPDYPKTHRAAAALLARMKSLGGLQWTSKQAGSGDAYVFYAPPLNDDAFKVIKKHPLDKGRGWSWIDRALRQAGIQRIPTDPRALRRVT